MSRAIVQPHAPIFDRPDALISRKYDIVDGKYDFAKNMLILNVEVIDELPGGVIEKRVEQRGFEVTSLKVRAKKAGERGEAEPVELIGARTDAAMQRMLPSIIRNLNQNINKDIFFSTAPSGKLTKKTIKFAQQFQEVAGATAEDPSIHRSVSGTTSTDSHYFGDEEDLDSFVEEVSQTLQVRSAPTTVQDIQTLRALLNYTNFESMIQGLGTEDQPILEHDADMSEVIINRNPNINAFATALVSTGHLQTASGRLQEVSDYASQLREVILLLDEKLIEIDAFLEDNKYLLSPDALTALKAERENVLQLKYKYHNEFAKTETASNLVKDLQMIEAMYGPRVLSQALYGSAPMSSYLTKELNNVMVQHDVNPSSDVEMGDFLAEKLALNMRLELDEAYVDECELVGSTMDEVSKYIVEDLLTDLRALNDKAVALLGIIPSDTHFDAIFDEVSDEIRSIKQKIHHYADIKQDLDEGSLVDRKLDVGNIKRFIANASAELILLENRLRQLERDLEAESVRDRRRYSTGSTTSRLSSTGDSEDELMRRLERLRATTPSSLFTGESEEESMDSRSSSPVLRTPTGSLLEEEAEPYVSGPRRLFEEKGLPMAATSAEESYRDIRAADGLTEEDLEQLGIFSE